MVLSKYLDPKNDVAFKKIFGTEKHKDILIAFLNDVLENGDGARIEDVQFLKTEQDVDAMAKKQSIVDVLCRDQSGQHYVVEMQVAKTKGFEERAQFYAAKAYTSQMNKGGLYHDLKRVIFLAITDFVMFPDKADTQRFKSDHVTLDTHDHEHHLTAFSFTFIELPKFTLKLEELDANSTLLEKWCCFFKYAPEVKTADIQRMVQDNATLKEAYEVLERFGWSDEELLSYDSEEKRIKDELAIQAERFDAGIAIGEARGFAKGEAKGFAKGEANSLCRIAHSMHQDKIPLSSIAKLLQCTPAQVRALLQSTPPGSS